VRRISNLRYADDIVLIATTIKELGDMVNRSVMVGKKYGTLIIDKCTENYNKR